MADFRKFDPDRTGTERLSSAPQDSEAHVPVSPQQCLRSPSMLHSNMLFPQVGDMESMSAIFGHWTDGPCSASDNDQENNQTVTQNPILKKPDTVRDYVNIIKHIEKAFPEWNGEQVLNNIRAFSSFDDYKFQQLYGLDKSEATWGKAYGHNLNKIQKSPLMSDSLNPDGIITDIQSDPDKIRKLMSERGIPEDEINSLIRMNDRVQNQKTGGIVLDENGRELTISHVLTGLSGSIYRNRKTMISSANNFGIGDEVDNLYASTISGDLGQSASIHNAGKQNGLIGKDTEATYPELVGDIDGFLLGKNLDKITKGKSLSEKGEHGVSLSDVLGKYYQLDKPDNEQSAGDALLAENRFSMMQKEMLATETDRDGKKLSGADLLLEETMHFSDNYDYHDRASGKWKGAFTSSSKSAKSVNSEFLKWINMEATSQMLNNAGSAGVRGSTSK